MPTGRNKTKFDKATEMTAAVCNFARVAKP